jgi:hypothetical protein
MLSAWIVVYAGFSSKGAEATGFFAGEAATAGAGVAFGFDESGILAFVFALITFTKLFTTSRIGGIFPSHAPSYTSYNSIINPLTSIMLIGAN